MRLFVDQGFPASVPQYGTATVEFWRWTAGGISDEDLVAEAQLEGCQGVIFLGVRPLISRQLRDLAKSKGLWLAGTQTTNPFEAQRALGNNVAAIEKRAAPGLVHQILTREMRAA